MGLDGADSFDKRSLSSVHSHLSLFAFRNAVAMAVEQKRPMSTGDDGVCSSPVEEVPMRV